MSHSMSSSLHLFGVEGGIYYYYKAFLALKKVLFMTETEFWRGQEIGVEGEKGRYA